MNRKTSSLLLTGALVLSLSGSALALSLTVTQHYFFGVEPGEMVTELTVDPELMFGSGTVSNRIVTSGDPQNAAGTDPYGKGSVVVQEFDTSAYWAAGVPSVHVKMTTEHVRDCWAYVACWTAYFDIVVTVSGGATGQVRHRFSGTSNTSWKHDFTALKSTGGALETELLREVHKLVVIPNVTALATQIAVGL